MILKSVVVVVVAVVAVAVVVVVVVVVVAELIAVVIMWFLISNNSRGHRRRRQRHLSLLLSCIPLHVLVPLNPLLLFIITCISLALVLFWLPPTLQSNSDRRLWLRL